MRITCFVLLIILLNALKAEVSTPNGTGNTPSAIGASYTMRWIFYENMEPFYFGEPNKLERVSGIYVIRCLVNERIYIGQSKNLRNRFFDYQSKRNTGSILISKSIAKHGIANFIFYVLRYMPQIELNYWEMFYIHMFTPEYNMTRGGTGNRGLCFSGEALKRMSEKSKELWDKKSDEEKQHIIKNHLIGPKKGHLVLPSTREKLRQHNIGKKATIESRRKQSESQKISMKGNTNGKKPVLKIGKNGEVIMRYEQVKIAAQDVGVCPEQISRALAGKIKTSGGYKWKFA